MALFETIGNTNILNWQKKNTEEEKNMEYQKEDFNLEQLQVAKQNGSIMQGFVSKCDDNYNLQVYLGKNLVGIIPRNEMDAMHQDDFGMTRSSICKNKVNQFVQFKVKEIYDENRLLLSRKEVRKRGFKLGKK